jgi:hypothetical protein
MVEMANETVEKVSSPHPAVNQMEYQVDLPQHVAAIRQHPLWGNSIIR